MYSNKQDVSNSLVSAVEKGELKVARELNNYFGFSFSSEWWNGYNLLRDAIRSNKHREDIELLLTSLIKLNSEVKYPTETPLYYAVLNDDMEIAKMLLDRSADVDAINVNDKTPLSVAIEKNIIEIIELLLERGAYINDPSVKKGGYTKYYTYTSLHIAIQHDSEKIVKLLLERGADVNAKAGCNLTPLHIAAEKGYSKIAANLLKHGAYVNCMSTHGTTPYRKGYTSLYFAVQKGFEQTVRVLLSYGADTNVNCMNDKTPLYIAICFKYEKIVKILLEHGANVNAEDKYGKTILYHAVEKGCSAIIENILEYNPTYNPENKYNCELFHTSVEKGYIKIVESLLKCGIDVNIFDRRSSTKSTKLTPLHNAVIKNREEVVALLINYGADVNAKDRNKKTPIIYAIENADLKIIKLLLSNGADIRGNPDVLNAAVKEKSKEMIELLLDNGANINASDEYGKTALHCCSKEDIAKLLISRGANVAAQNLLGKTAIHTAIERGYVKVVETHLDYNTNINLSSTDITPHHLSTLNELITTMLLNKGANVNAKNKDGTTALHLAVQQNYIKTVEVLLNYNARVEAKCLGNTTSIHLAAERNFVKIVQLLLKYGANIDSRDDLGKTALHLASKRGNTETIVALLKYGADVNIIDKAQHTPVENCKQCSYRCFDILQEHLIKMRTANLYLHRKNLETIRNIDSCDLINECNKELESMKNEKIDNIPFHDILMKNINQMAHFTRNENIMQTLKSDDFKTKFPIYASMMNNHLKKAVVRMELLEQVRTFINFPLPYICTEKIFSYLNTEDLRELIYLQTSSGVHNSQ